MADYLFQSMLRSCSSGSSFWPSFFFIFFLKWAESHSADLKVFRCYSLFYTSSFWFPEVLPTCDMRSHWVFLFFFLLGHLTLEKDVPSPLFLVFLFVFFFYTVFSNCSLCFYCGRFTLSLCFPKSFILRSLFSLFKQSAIPVFPFPFFQSSFLLIIPIALMASCSSWKRRKRTPSPSEGEGSSGSSQSESHEVTERSAFPLQDPW